MVSVFSIPAFFIVLREVMEACLVVGIALAYFSKIGSSQYNRYVWFGAIGGIVVSGVVGITFAVVYFTKGDQIFTGKTEKIFEGIAFLVAAGLLTWMIIWMMHMGKQIREHIERQLETMLDDENRSGTSKKTGVFFMVFVQVLREGIETFIFLFGSVSADEYGSWRAIPIPGLLAVIVGIAISYLVFKGLLVLDIQSFFEISSIILIAFAAGLVSHAFHELQEVNWFGNWYDDGDKSLRDWYNSAMWDTKTCCADDENEFFAMLRALFGYQDTPTFIEWITYFAYWVIVIALFVTINFDRIKSSTRKIRSRAQALSALTLLCTFVGFVYALINRSWIGLLSMITSFFLTIITVFFVFENATRLISSMLPLRKSALGFLGVAWGLNTLFVAALHLVQLICEGKNEEQCPIQKFFFFGIILNSSFSELHKVVIRSDEDPTDITKIYWPAIAVLSISLIVAIFLFGGLSFRLLLMSTHVNRQGVYETDGEEKIIESLEHDERDVFRLKEHQDVSAGSE